MRFGGEFRTGYLGGALVSTAQNFGDDESNDESPQAGAPSDGKRRGYADDQWNHETEQCCERIGLGKRRWPSWTLVIEDESVGCGNERNTTGCDECCSRQACG